MDDTIYFFYAQSELRDVGYQWAALGLQPIMIEACEKNIKHVVRVAWITQTTDNNQDGKIAKV